MALHEVGGPVRMLPLDAVWSEGCDSFFNALIDRVIGTYADESPRQIGASHAKLQCGDPAIAHPGYMGWGDRQPIKQGGQVIGDLLIGDLIHGIIGPSMA